MQVAELHKLAVTPDLLDDPPGGFFKSLLPWARRGGGDSHMAWLKLVDEAGRTAGHAVLSARVATGLGEPQGLMGPPPTLRGTPLIEEVQTWSLGSGAAERQRAKPQHSPPPQQQQALALPSTALVPRLPERSGRAPQQTANVTGGLHACVLGGGGQELAWLTWQSHAGELHV